MSFPFEFVKASGKYDVFANSINLAGNSAVLAIGGLSLAVLSSVALKALGFSKIAASIAVAIPVTIGAIGVAGLAIGGGLCLAMIFLMVSSLKRS